MRLLVVEDEFRIALAIKRALELQNYSERLFYISGARPMVTSVQKALHSLGVKEKQVKVDFFSGY